MIPDHILKLMGVKRRC